MGGQGVSIVKFLASRRNSLIKAHTDQQSSEDTSFKIQKSPKEMPCRRAVGRGKEGSLDPEGGTSF